ncbi:MAG: hypothetical protein Q8P18_11065 [Pseudomonadota bacterium]|nr:hypothetical protein [Pseudomonadota bacterium]
MHLAQRPRVPCPVATAFVTTWESQLGDHDRRLIVAPLRARLGGTRTSTGSAVYKAAAACDWLVHTCAPAWLEIADADPIALSALRTCPPLLVDTDTRKGRIAIDRAIQSVLAARMITCNAAWSRSRPPSEALAEEGRALSEQLLPRALDGALGRTGFHAAIAAADRAPFTSRWPTLRDHLLGLAQAATAALTWQAVWAAASARENGAGAWASGAERRLGREITVLTAHLQPHALHLAQQILSP